MKASISSIWLVGLVLVFLLIFSAYIIITVDYSKSFKLKNEVVSIVEKNKGMVYKKGSLLKSTVKDGVKVVGDLGSIKTINAYLAASSYTAKGSCNYDTSKSGGSVVWYGVKNLGYKKDDTAASNVYEKAKDGSTYYYCFAKFKTGRSDLEVYGSVYYKVILFYKFEIPVLSELLPVRIEGMTDEIYRPANDNLHLNDDIYS